MRLATVICDAFIGDSLFASSVVEQLKIQDVYDKVTLFIKVPQPIELLKANPNIDDVYVPGTGAVSGDVLFIPKATWDEPAPQQFQRACKVPNPINHYKVYVPELRKNEAKSWIDDIRLKYPNTPIVGYHRNWKERTFLYNRDQYEAGVNIPHLGYGGARRNVERILSALSEQVVLVDTGLDAGVSQFDASATIDKYTRDAALISQCDWYIGGEGGMTNLAAGLGIRCIITSDFHWMLYGPNGLFQKHDDPKMGPKNLFPNAGHIHLDPFLTDDEVIEQMTKLICE